VPSTGATSSCAAPDSGPPSSWRRCLSPGVGGLRLDDAWADGASAYLGLAVPGFPNLFLSYGPNTDTGNTSVVHFHESQARYLVRAVRALAAGAGPLEVRPEVARRFDDAMRDRLGDSVWAGCDSWYRTSSGRVVTNWPGSAHEYRRRTARFEPADYRTPSPAAPSASSASSAAR
jgi:hypothetical protein